MDGLKELFSILCRSQTSIHVLTLEHECGLHMDPAPESEITIQWATVTGAEYIQQDTTAGRAKCDKNASQERLYYGLIETNSS